MPADNAAAWDKYSAAYQAAARLQTDVAHERAAEVQTVDLRQHRCTRESLETRVADALRRQIEKERVLHTGQLGQAVEAFNETGVSKLSRTVPIR